MKLQALTRHTIITAAVSAIALSSIHTTASANHCMYKSMQKSYGMPYGKYRGYGPMYGPMYGHGYGYGNHGYGMKGYGMGHPPMYAYGAGMYDQGYSKGMSKPTKDSAAAQKDVVDTAIAAGKFNTLVKAVEAAGLVEVLKGDGPYTVFAPTDEAFANLPEGKLDALLADKEKLVAVLKYHVVPGNMSAADILQARELKTAEGQTLSVENIEVAKADIKASNGTIHVVDSVLIPSM